jgi:DNA-binding transcriptional regulator of glucitol operon
MSRRLSIAGLCLLSLIVCCGLAWWQWDRYQSASGTFQNLGYVLQWPLFGLFPAFMAYRIRKLRRAALAADEAAQADQTVPRPADRPAVTSPAKAAGAEPGARAARPVLEVPAQRPRAPRLVVHDEEDEELAAYNRYLAELNARDQENHEKGKS